MQPIDFDNAAAFTPFFTERVEISGPRPDGVELRGTYAVCLLFGGSSPALVNLSPQNEATLLTVLVARRGDGAWNRTEQPQIGDTVRLRDGRRFDVKRVDALDDTHYTLEAREC